MVGTFDASTPEVRRHALHSLWLRVLWLTLFAVTRAAVADADPDPLTPAQRAWLETHPHIVIGGGDDWPPWLIRDTDGRLSGFAVDHLALLNAKLGTAIELEAGPWHEIVAQAEAGALDGLTLSAPLAERGAHFLFTQPFVTVPDFLYLRDGDSPPADGLPGLSGRVGYLRDLQRVRDRLAAYPAIEAIPMDSQAVLAEALTDGRIDAVVGSYALDYWRARHGVLGLGPKQMLPPDGRRTELVYSVRRDWPQLVEILNRGLAAITKEETAKLHRRWFGAAISEREVSRQVTLDAPERAWLRQHTVLRAGIDSAWAPVEYVDADGQPQGISVAYLKRLEEGLEVRFELVPMPSWSTAMRQLEDGKIDLLPAITDLPARHRRLLFTQPYVSFPAVIFARNEVAYLGGIDALVGKHVAVIRDDAVQRWLAEGHSEIDLLPVTDTRAGLRAVSQGDAFAFVGNLATTSHYLSQSGLTQIKVAGETVFRYRLSMAVRADQPLLASILQQGVDAIPASERAAIYNEWRSIRYSQAMDLSLLWQVLAGGAVVIAVVGWWNRRLVREVKRRRRAEAALIEARDRAEKASRAKSDFLSNISHELRTPLNLLLGSSGLLRDHLEQRRADTGEAGWLDAIMAAGRTLAHLIDDLLDLSRIEAGQLRLRPSPVDLRALLRELVALFAQASADKGLRLTLDLDAKLPSTLSLDALRLRQILINLIGNAVKFTETGAIRMHAQADAVGNDRVHLRIRVQDSGPGIDNAQLASIFEPFEQVLGSANDRRSVGVGLGLGLSISRRLARLMGGEIAVESRLGQGSCFTLDLPGVAVVSLAPDVSPTEEDISFTDAALPTGATHSGRDPAHVPGQEPFRNLPTPLMAAAPPSAEAVVERLPADLREQLQTLRPPLASINAIESFVESLSVRAQELDDADLLRSAEELRAAADAFNLPVLNACLDSLRAPAERAAGPTGSAPS